jgi:hypothetical protein
MLSHASSTCGHGKKSPGRRITGKLPICGKQDQSSGMYTCRASQLTKEKKFSNPAKCFHSKLNCTLKNPMPYVGRGGLKMENFLKETTWDLNGSSLSRSWSVNRWVYRLLTATRSSLLLPAWMWAGGNYTTNSGWMSGLPILKK